jgi:hypothetical protein
MMRRIRYARAGLIVVVGALASVATATAGHASPVPDSASALTAMTIPVDRQDYVTAFTKTNPSDGSTIDPYDADPSSIHVAINGGNEFARSFVHMALDYLPPGASATSLTMTLHVTQQSDASNTGVYQAYNVNTKAAIVEACALTTELPSKFDYTNPPAYDCAHGSAIGKPNANLDTWTFDLHDLLGYWAQHGNTGAALIPVGSGDPSQNWGVAFYKSRAAATVKYLLAATANSGPPVSSSAVPPPSTTTNTAPPPSTSTALPPQATSTAPSSAPVPPAVAPNQTAPAYGGVSHRSGNSGNNTIWPWVLLGSLGLAAGSVGFAHRGALVAALPRGVAMFHTHPRSYAVACAALSWGLVFTTYSLVTQPSNSNGGQNLAGDTQNGAVNPTTGSQQGTQQSTQAGQARNVAVPSSGGVSQAAASSQAASNPSVAAAATEFNGGGTWQTINGVRVFFPANGGVPVAQLYSGADDVVGMSSKQIEICGHAALTYGSAFHISASDLNVYWSYVNDHGGIFGRSVHGDYTNDNYDPGTAVQAAQQCKDKNTFFLLGGIGFDQIPAVRQWAEQNHMLYLHHIATIEGSAGLRYSYSALPTVEQTGTYFGEVVARQFPHKNIAIIYRASSNWTPALAPFKKFVQQSGSKIVGEYPVQINQGNYTQELTEARSAGADVVFSWENALSEIEMIKQAQGQNWHPAWLVNGFNIITNTLGSTALDQDMWSPAEWDSYDPGYYGGGFAPYADQIKEFEAEYKQYDSSADLTGDGGDLLFLNWEAQKWIHDLLLTCGAGCTRNKLAGLLLAGYHKVTPPNCPASFEHSADHHHAGYLFNVLHAIKDPNGRANFVPVARCVTSY